MKSPRGKFFILLTLCLAGNSLSSAAIIGTNPPALSVSADRIATLPAPQQRNWSNYLARSNRQLQFDQDSLTAELREKKMAEPIVPPSSRSVSSLPLDKPADWYANTDAVRVADIVLSFQTPAGGWSKNLDFSAHPRARGEAFAPNNRSRLLGADDFDTPHDTNWNYVGTFDNDATTTELRYLAKVISALGTNNSVAYRKAFLRGIVYISEAQYPNGGWPQVWPLEGGYHDMITYNDNATANVLNFLLSVATDTNEYGFVPLSVRGLAGNCGNRGVECVLKSQITVGGHRTAWCQQYDPITLQPASGRNYEMPAAVSSESADIILFLMRLPRGNASLIAAVRDAAAWFEKTKISDMTWQRQEASTRNLVHQSGAGPIWARYYEIGTDRPIFGDRDKTIHDKLEETSSERRHGYAWYRDTPQRALEVYAVWSKKHPVVIGDTKK